MENDGIFSAHTNAPHASVLDALQSAAGDPFDHAHPIPAVVNHSAEFYTHERQKIFMQEWICIGRADEIAGADDYLTHQVTGAPVLVEALYRGSASTHLPGGHAPPD